MNEWVLLLVAATLGSIVSLIGGVYLLYGARGAVWLRQLSVPFAAGALLAAAFLDLLPESIDKWQPSQALIMAMIGLVAFFVFERSAGWFHHHHEEDAHIVGRRNSMLIVTGNTIHNFIDGLAIGAAFLVSPATGIVTTVAVAAHEIPKEIGDFGLLLAKGMRRARVLWLNLLGTIATVMGASIVYGVGDAMGTIESILLSLTAGFFIYIAASDIIPTIHNERRRNVATMQTIVLIFGIIFVAVVQQVVHGFIER
jgi:zinc and cadmium transporter